MPDGSPSYADPRYVLKRALKKAADLGFTFYTHPEVEFFLFKDPRPARRAADAGRPVRATSTTPRRAWAATSAAARSPCWSRWASRWSSPTTRAAPGQQEIDLRYADALSTADNLMTFRVVVKEVALSQGIHASFMPKPFTEHPGLRHAHPHVAVRGRQQRLLRRQRRAPPVQGRPVLHRRAAPARRRDHRGDQPVGQLLQAAGRRRRGAELHLLGPQQPLGAGPGADVQAQQGILGPGRAALDRLRRQPVPGLRADAGRRAGRASRASTSCPRAPRTTSGR